MYYIYTFKYVRGQVPRAAAVWSVTYPNDGSNRIKTDTLFDYNTIRVVLTRLLCVCCRCIRSSLCTLCIGVDERI